MDRRNFLRALGISSAVVPAAGGEIIHADVPVKKAAHVHHPMYEGIDFDYDTVSSWIYCSLTIAPYEMKDFYILGDPANGFYWDTNMHRPFSIAPPTLVAVQEIGVLFSPVCFGPAMNRFIERSSLEFWIGQKNFFHGPLAGLFEVGEDAGARDPRTGPGIALKGFEKLDLPLLIDHNDHFNWQLNVDPFRTSQKIKLWAVMKVREARAVQ